MENIFTGYEPNVNNEEGAEDGEEEELDAPRRQGSAYVEDIGAMTEDPLPPLPEDEDEFDLFSGSAAGSRSPQRAAGVGGFDGP